MVCPVVASRPSYAPSQHPKSWGGFRLVGVKLAGFEVECDHSRARHLYQWPVSIDQLLIILGVVREIQGCKDNKSKDSGERCIWSLYVGASSYQSVVDFLN